MTHETHKGTKARDPRDLADSLIIVNRNKMSSMNTNDPKIVNIEKYQEMKLRIAE